MRGVIRGPKRLIRGPLEVQITQVYRRREFNSFNDRYPNLKVYQHTYPTERVNERFYYTHGQLIIRGVIERKLVGLPDIGILLFLSLEGSSYVFSSTGF